MSLPHMAAFGLEWSPRGNQPAFYAYKVMETGVVWGLGVSHPDVYVVDVSGRGLTPVTADGLSSHPRWSPDGTRLAYTSSRDGVRRIYVSGAGLLAPATLVSRTGLSHSADAPTWSPDGRWIAYLADTRPPDRLVGYSDAELWLANPDGSAQHDLRQTAYWGGLDWSPDSRSLAFTSRTSFDPATAHEVHTLRLGGRPSFVMHGLFPRWAPDGQHLAVTVAATSSPYRHVKTVNVRTGAITAVLSGDYEVATDYVWTRGRPAAHRATA